jgi:hypothetical protein
MCIMLYPDLDAPGSAQEGNMGEHARPLNSQCRSPFHRFCEQPRCTSVPRQQGLIEPAEKSNCWLDVGSATLCTSVRLHPMPALPQRHRSSHWCTA